MAKKNKDTVEKTSVKTFIVADGCSFTSNGYVYVAGDEIPEAAFPNKTVFAKHVAAGKIKGTMTEVLDSDNELEITEAKQKLKVAEEVEAKALEAAKIAAEKAALENATDEEKKEAEKLQAEAENAVKLREEAEAELKALE